MIRKFQKRDTTAVADLARNTFAACNAGDYYDLAGVKKTLRSFDTHQHGEQELFDMLNSTDIFFVCEDCGQIVGMIRGGKNRIHSLFVDVASQNNGVGSLLMEKFERCATAQGAAYIEVHALLAAAAFYEKMGYEKLGGICDFEGLKIYNMRKNF